MLLFTPLGSHSTKKFKPFTHAFWLQLILGACDQRAVVNGFLRGASQPVGVYRVLMLAWGSGWKHRVIEYLLFRCVDPQHQHYYVLT
jgi:hypothetical protein